ncbi:pyridoxal-phosphate dependent enzyme, partial [Candidatus Saccharibacteria bacterium]|nr:pyridoxal-phosphate dependent enzyme [Candidatus Saccharibacteria bacterium]
GEIYGVQLEGADAFARSMCAGDTTELDYANPLSDGTAVRRAGEIALRHVRASSQYVDTLIVSEAELGEAMMLQDQITGVYGEPAGCLALAGIQKLAHSNGLVHEQNWLAIISGKHRDPLRYKALISATQNACG